MGRRRGRATLALLVAVAVAVAACGGRDADGAPPVAKDAAAEPARDEGIDVPNLGFDVRGGWALPDLRGFVIASFGDACWPVNARPGARLLVVRFNDAVGTPEVGRSYVVASRLQAEVPSGASDFVDLGELACLDRTAGADQFMSGSVVFRRIADDAVEGEVRGLVVHPGQTSGGDLVVGTFRLPRCFGACGIE